MGVLSLSGLSQAQTTALAAGNFALVVPALLGGSPKGIQPATTFNADGTPQPVQPAFLFQYEGENKTTLESDITDHYIEDNTAIQDQIALHPIIVSTHGFIGELNDVPSGALAGVLGAARIITDKLQGVSGYAPGLSKAAQNVYNTAAQTYQTAQSIYNSAKSVLDSIQGNTATQGLQAQAYLKFKTWWQNRQLFNVQTPWEYIRNVAIQSLVATQSESTNAITDFFVTFKQITFVSSNLEPSLGSALYNAATGQVAIGAPQTGIPNPSVGSPLWLSTVGSQ